MAKLDFEAMVKELLAYDPKGDMPRLTAWEVGFLDDVSSPRKADFTGSPLGWSPKQREKVEHIWERIFA